MVVIEEEQLRDSYCECCKNVIRNFIGRVESGGQLVSDYWLRVPEGHGGHYTLGICIERATNPRGVVLIGEATPKGKTYWIQDESNSPWSDFGSSGRVMNRSEVLEDESKSLFFELADAIANSDKRLISHVEKYQ